MGTLTIGQAATELGISTHALRYYERAGLVRTVARATNGHRRYSSEDIDRLRFLHCLRSVEMPIHRIREYADLAYGGRATAATRIEVLRDYRRECQARIEEVQVAIDVIDRKIERLQAATVQQPHMETERC